MAAQRAPLRPDRIRTVERPFAWLPCRLLTRGWLTQMSSHAKLLYLGLALAADRRGVSFWGDQRLKDLLGLTSAELQRTRHELIAIDLLAFDGRTYQMLSLPTAPSPASPVSASPGPAIRPTPEPDPDPGAQIPASAREALRKILGRDFNA